ncbi:serine/threonine-protein kinase [Streptosporangium sp. KLBMP 9127]|nr:serine/threonine protein kinase [Streptosporangium sp. KLBMP 9127]
MIGARRLAGRYRLLNPLGEGALGTVWLAADDVLGRDVAVKEVRLPPGLEESRRREICEAAVREANVAARLKHPSIVTVHDVLIEDGSPWLVMELLSGTSLAETVRQQGPLPPHQVARAGMHLLSALTVAHAAGVVHRDVKPSNVFLTRTGRAVLTDFGMAAIEGEPSANRTMHLVGAPAFIAPERLRGEPDGPAGDLWSLGATLYFGVEGVAPHHSESPIRVLTMVLTEPPRLPERAGPLGPILMRLLGSEPADRPPAAVTADILRGIAGVRRQPPDTPPTPAVRQAAPPAPRRRRTGLVLAAAVAALAAIAAGTAFGVNAVTGTEKAAAPSPSPTRLSESPGKFGIPVKFCETLTAEQVGGLVTDSLKNKKGTPNNKGGCEWLGKGMGLSAEPVGFEEQWGSSPQRAHERFVSQRNLTIPSGTVGWAWPEVGVALRSARATAAEPVSGIGDEAYAYHQYDNRSHLKLEQSSIVMRVDNLVVEVGYTVIDGKREEKDIREGARTAARWIAQSLQRTG